MKFLSHFNLFLVYALLTTIPTTFRGFLWQAEAPGRVLLELSSVVIFLPDFFLIALFTVTLLRFLLDKNFHQTFTHTVERAIRQDGGIFWILLILWAMVSYIWAREKVLVQYTVFRLVLELSLALVVANSVRHEAKAKTHFALALIFGAVFQAILALTQVIHGDAIGLTFLGERPADEFYTAGGLLRGYGLSVNPNNLSGYLLVGCVSLLDFYNSAQFSENMRTRYIASLQTNIRRDGIYAVRHILRGGVTQWVGSVILLGLLATGSRTAILSLIITGFLVYAMTKGNFWQSMVWILLVLLTIGRILVWREGRVAVADRLFFAYDDTLEVLKTSPILGVGADNLMVEISHQHPFETDLLLPAHNAFLMIWAELGLPGLIFVLAFFWTVLRSLHSRNIWAWCLLAIGIVMLFDFYFWGDFRSRVLWFFVIGMWWGDEQENPHGP